MIAAAPDLSSRLGLLSVVLTSVQSDPSTEISEALKEHVVAILRSAADITANPHAIAATTSAEAIELANKIREDPALLQRLEKLSDFNAIRPEVATAILRSLRSIAA